MIVWKNNFIPFGNYSTMNFYGILITKTELSDKVINHESIHTKQIIELAIAATIVFFPIMFIFNLSIWWLLASLSAFYIWYGLEYLLIRVFRIRDEQNDCYHDISLEEEAHNNDDNLNYLKSRKPFNWFKYIRIRSYNKK